MNPIEETLKCLYKDKRYGELKALYGMFSPRLAEAINTHLLTTLNFPEKERLFERLYIDFQWVDKVPLAKFIKKQSDLYGNPITSKTEIGDMFIQFRHNTVYDNEMKSGSVNHHNRSLIVQAKLADTHPPVVPIGYINRKRANPTSKELKLLEDWPIFDLYETSGNKKPLAKSVEVKTEGPPFAFYGGFNNTDKTWLFGEAKKGKACERTLSSLIEDLAQGSVGKCVKFDDDWSTISSEINRICENRKLPKSIAKKIEPRKKSFAIHDFAVYSFPAQLSAMISELFEKIRSIFAPKKFFVLKIDRVTYEGSNLDQFR